MKKIILTICIFASMTFSTLASSKIKRYQFKVQKACESNHLNLLLLKKSLIEMVNGEECAGKFTSIVLNKCNSLNCQELSQIYKEVEQFRAGSVVGGE
jgi:hypothetical protein